jgi:hypothetical protein
MDENFIGEVQLLWLWLFHGYCFVTLTEKGLKNNINSVSGQKYHFHYVEASLRGDFKSNLFILPPF